MALRMDDRPLNEGTVSFARPAYCMKVCSKCKRSRPDSSFYRRHGTDKLRSHCKACIIARNTPSAKASTHRLYRTKEGKCRYTWRTIKQRCEGRLKGSENYAGLPFMSMADFEAWSLADPNYQRLYDQWQNAGYERSASFSINRLNDSEGYVAGNIEWITTRENSRLGRAAQLARA